MYATTRRIVAALAAAAITLLLWFSVANAQEVRHYRTEIHQREDEPELYQRLHFLVGSDGRAAVVVEMGPAGIPPQAGGAVGSITSSEEGDGTAAFCFTVDELEGMLKGAPMIGRVSCWIWLKEEDVIFETGDVLWGPATSPELRWCGEPHNLDTPPVEREYGS